MDNVNYKSKSQEEIFNILERNPMCVPAWERLLSLVCETQDILSKDSLLVILEGLLIMENRRIVPTSAFVRLLGRMVRSYNDSDLMNELGVLYREDLNLPRVAFTHFDRAKHLRSEPKENPVVPSGDKGLGVVKRPSGMRLGKAVFRKTARIGLFTTNTAPVNLSTSETIPLPTGEAAPSWTSALEAIRDRKCPAAFEMLDGLNDEAITVEQRWDAWTDLGEACLELNDLQKAAVAYHRAFLLMPQFMLSNFNLATALLMIGKLEEALQRFEDADALERDNPKVWCNIGNVYFLQGKYRESAAALRKCLEIKPDYFRAWNNLTSALGAFGDLDGAMVACRQALELAPGMPEIQFKLGLISYYKDDWENAVPCFSQSLGIAELDRFSHAYLCMAFCKLGELEKAQIALSSAAKSSSDSQVLGEAWSSLGLLYAKNGLLTESKRAHRESVLLDADSSEYWTYLALAHQQVGEYQESQACFLRVSHLSRMQEVA